MDFDIEIEALSRNCKAEPNDRLVSQKQVGGICGLLKQGLEDNGRDMQVAVLGELVGDAMWDIAGVRITSRKNLTGRVASVLIEQLKDPDEWKLSEYGRQLIKEAENRIRSKEYA